MHTGCHEKRLSVQSESLVWEGYRFACRFGSRGPAFGRVFRRAWRAPGVRRQLFRAREAQRSPAGSRTAISGCGARSRRDSVAVSRVQEAVESGEISGDRQTRQSGGRRWTKKRRACVRTVKVPRRFHRPPFAHLCLPPGSRELRRGPVGTARSGFRAAGDPLLHTPCHRARTERERCGGGLAASPWRIRQRCCQCQGDAR